MRCLWRGGSSHDLAPILYLWAYMYIVCITMLLTHLLQTIHGTVPDTRHVAGGRPVRSRSGAVCQLHDCGDCSGLPPRHCCRAVVTASCHRLLYWCPAAACAIPSNPARNFFHLQGPPLLARLQRDMPCVHAHALSICTEHNYLDASGWVQYMNLAVLSKD